MHISIYAYVSMYLSIYPSIYLSIYLNGHGEANRRNLELFLMRLQ